jgi:predicted ABC-class ATPase
MRYIALACFSLFLIAATARADWLEASSDHFVIYGDESERDVGQFAERLELYHSAMAYLFAKPQTKPGPSNRVTIFVVSTASQLQATTTRQSAHPGKHTDAALRLLKEVEGKLEE